MYTVFLKDMNTRRWRKARQFFELHDIEMNIVHIDEHFFPYHHFLHIISFVGIENILKRTSLNEPGIIHDEVFQDMTLRESYEFLKQNRRWVRDYIFYSENNVIVGINDDDLTCFIPKHKKREEFERILSRLDEEFDAEELIPS